jgi:hypothetical protein
VNSQKRYRCVFYPRLSCPVRKAMAEAQTTPKKQRGFFTAFGLGLLISYYRWKRGNADACSEEEYFETRN